MREDAVHDGGVVEPMGMAEAECYGAVRSRYWTRAALMRRAFDLEVLRGPRCAGRMELLATIVSRDPISSRPHKLRASKLWAKGGIEPPLEFESHGAHG